MKKLNLLLLIVSVLLLANGYSQKPKKTYDSYKFANKVRFSFVPEYVNSRGPDAAALQYIADKTGKKLYEVEDQDKLDRKSMQADCAEFKKYGLIFVVDKVEEKIKQETPVKIADLVCHCTSGTEKFILILENCVQTDISWYLGDGCSWEGDVFGDLGKELAEKEEKEKAEQEERDRKKAEELRQQYVYDSIRVVRPGWESEKTKYEWNPNYEGLPMSGYYVTNTGEKVNAIIAYQKPEFFVGDFAPSSQLFICKSENGKRVDLLNSGSDENFKEYVSKDQIKAFYLNGYLFKNIPKVGWRIALDEGAVHSFITVVKIGSGETATYQAFKQTQKLDGQVYGSVITSITTDNLLSLMSEAPDIVQAFNDGKLDKYQVEVEYNSWYEKTYPGRANYIFGSDYGQAEFNTKYSDYLAGNADATTETAPTKPKVDHGLPPEFEGLVGGWKFKAVFDGDNEMTDQYKDGFLNERPITMYIEDDTYVMFQKGVRDRNNFEYCFWKYLKPEDRKEKEPEIDFTLTYHNKDGNTSTEKFTLVSVTDTELIYENKMLNMRWVWTRSN